MSAVAMVGRVRAGFLEIVSDPARMSFMRKSLFWVAFAWVALSIAVPAFAKHYQLGLDLEEIRCMPWRAYVIKYERNVEFKRGGFVAFRDHDGQMGPKFKGRILGKKVVGLPGDRLAVRGDFAWVNDQAIGALTLHDKLGKKLGDFDREEIVPEGKILVVGTLPQSYDGRYWGFLNQRNVIGSLSPLF